MSAVDAEGRTRLHYAALADDVDVVNALLCEGANPNVRDRLGFTPLHFAAQQGAVAVAEILLAAGADVDPANSYGNTPLFTAVVNSRGHGELIELLRHHGADPRHSNNAGQTPVGLAGLIANYDVGQFFADLADPGRAT